MSVLFLSDAYPWPLANGGAMRNFHILEALARQHHVTLVSFTPPLDAAAHGFPPSPLPGMCHRIIDAGALRPITDKLHEQYESFVPYRRRLWNTFCGPMSRAGAVWSCPPIVEVIAKALRESQPQVVWADQSQLAEAAWTAGARRIVGDVDDILWTFSYRELQRKPWYLSKPLHTIDMLKLMLHERMLPRWLWRTIICKESDRRWFSGNPNHVCVVPNGFDPVARSDRSKERRGEILFVGSLDYHPNADAALYFAREVFPTVRASVPGAVFRIVGRAPGADLLALHDDKTIHVHGSVPELEPYYEAAAVVVSPLRLGGGTKLKVLEALARGKALVATPESVEGFDLVPGRHFEAAANAAEFAAACVKLLTDDVARQRLYDAGGREMVLAGHDWATIGAAVLRAVE